MVNTHIILGRLGQDPTIRKTEGGMTIASFSVATDRYAKKGEERKTDWHNIVTFDKTAEFVERNLKKGDQVYVEGPSQTNSWTDKDTSQKKYKTEVVGRNVKKIFGPRGDDSGSNAGVQTTPADTETSIEEDGIPF